MSVKSGTTWAGIIVTLDATGALATPSSGPTGVLYIDGEANGAEVTISGANPYKWSVTLPALTAGQRVDMYITATIATIATAGVVASEQADTALLSEVEAAVPTAVWASATRTLTQSAASVVAVLAGSDITIQRGDTETISLTDIGALTGYTKLWFTVKGRKSQADSASLLQIEKTGGLLYLNGAVASTASDGSITISDEATGDISIVIKAAATAVLEPGAYYYDIQMLSASGVNTMTYGTFTIEGDVTRTVA